LGYAAPDDLRNEDKTWNRDAKKLCFHPYEEIEVVQEKAAADDKHIHIDEPLIAWANRNQEVNFDISGGHPDDFQHGDTDHANVLEMRDILGIYFHRTVRMPDDEKLHQLPGSLGTFPLYSVNAYADKLPDNVVREGGIFLPMWQREAMWMSFIPRSDRRCALRVFVGRINAVSGRQMDEATDIDQDAPQPIQDYVVVPGQEWLDGICVAPGIVRQFVAMPCKSSPTCNTRPLTRVAIL
jgi:hypothetical protein